jgi:hypothetical protein
MLDPVAAPRLNAFVRDYFDGGPGSGDSAVTLFDSIAISQFQSI